MTATNSTSRPEKPYPEFPLFAAHNGQWAKKFKGKRYYFGPWDDPQAALNRWLEHRDNHEADYTPPAATDQTTIADMVEAFMDAKELKVEAGDLAQRTLDDYHDVGKWLVEHFGHNRPVASLRAQDFAKLRATFPKTWSTKSVTNQIMRTRTIFKWAYENEKIERPVKYGDNFSKPTKRRRKLEQRSKPKKEFSASEIRRLISKSSDQMAAMILLGVNCGYGNKDCSRLTLTDIRGAWLDVPRGKTGQERKAWLWPETRKAIAIAIEERRGITPKDGCENLVFLTRTGQAWVSETDKRNAVTVEFAKAKKDAKCHRPGVGFYALRHTFETVAGETKDQVAVDYVMGHEDADDMSSVYREDVSDARIKAACSCVRKWFVAGKPKRGAAK